MSQFSDYPQNPYQAPNPAPILASPPKASLPTFSIVMFIIDLIFMLFRVLFVAAGIFGMMVSPDDFVQQTGPFEIIAGALMAVFGITADIAMLLRQRWGVSLAAVKVIATFGSIGVGLWQFGFLVDRAPANSPQIVGMWIGVIISLGIRLTLIGLYVWAVVLFHKSMNRQPVK